MERPDYEETMLYWDEIRKTIRDLPGASLSTDMFESLIYRYDDYIDYLENELKKKGD